MRYIGRRHYEPDEKRFRGAFRVAGHPGVAWYALGWETEPDDDTEWSGYEVRTGRVVCRMVGDDTDFTFEPSDLTRLRRRDYCGGCGQIGCGHGR